MAESVSDKYKVPAGLRPLLEAFARETLRAQPSDIYAFGWRLKSGARVTHAASGSSSSTSCRCTESVSPAFPWDSIMQ